MVSTYTTRNRIEKQGTGDNPNTWGARLGNWADMMDESVDGYLAVDVAGAVDTTLTVANASTDQSRPRVLKLTGAITAAKAVICPAVHKNYLIWNATTGSFALTLKPSGGTGITIPQGYKGVVYTDGSTMFQVTPWLNATGTLQVDTDGAARTDVPRIGQLQDGASFLGSGTFGGTANALTITLAPAITAYVAGMRIRAKIAATNTTVGGTLDANSVAPTAIERTPGVPIQPGDLVLGSDAEFVYDATTPSWLISGWHLAAVATAFAPTPTIKGLGGATAADTEHDITTAAGWAWDSTYASRMNLASAITKQIDNSWSVGDAAGGMDTGSVAADTWYARHLIQRSDTGVVDVLFSLSDTGPTLPANYDYFRFIGWHLTDASGNIIKVLQAGDRFIWDNEVMDMNEELTSLTAVLQTITAPPNSRPIIQARSSSPSALRYIRITSPEMSDTTPTATLHNMVGPGTGLAVVVYDGTFKLNGSSQIRHRADAGPPPLTLLTLGWIDRRGQDG